MLFIDQYIKEESFKIYETIKHRKLIYLDLKYWVLLRDKKDSPNPVEAQIIAKVNELFESNKCIFPISEITFREIQKQSDEITRNATMALVEKLSEGISLIGEHERVRIEYLNWFQTVQKSELTCTPQQAVWAQLPIVVGHFFYSKKVEELPLELRSAFLDFVNSIPLSTIPPNPNSPFVPFTGKDDIQALNENKQKFHHENRSMKEMFLSELWGCLDCFKDDLNAVHHEMYFKATGKVLTEAERAAEDQYAVCTLIQECFKKNKITNQLPTFKIFPSLFSSMRWNTSRKYTDGNDTLDVMHATAALPYCDYFFTEKELHTMILQEKLDQTFNCIVESNPNKILDILNSI